MADNPFTNGNGGLPSTQFRSQDTGAGQAFFTRAAPWTATILGYDLGVPIGGGAVKDGAGLTVPTNTAFAFMSVYIGDVRVRRDGTDPTGTQGVVLQAGFLGEVEWGASKTFSHFIGSASSPVATAFCDFEYRRYL